MGDCIKMKKIVINAEYGGFSLSDEAIEIYKDKKNIVDKNFYYYDIERDDPILVELVESEIDTEVLKVVEIPDNIDWVIEEYDGNEWIAEKHRRWS